MAESRPDPMTHSLLDKEVKAPNLFGRAKEEIQAILHSEKLPHHHKETHGKRNEIDENTPLDDVRAPNVFDRAKEELEALVQTIHHKKDSSTHERDETIKTESKQDRPDSLSDEEVKGPNLFGRAKEEIYGKRIEIDENTPLDDVRAPNVYDRAKEEFEALVQTIHPKKDSPAHERAETTKMESKKDEVDFLSENNVKGRNLIERAKEKIETITHHHKSSHYRHKETHGTRDDLDERTPINDVKGPNVFERAKEEIEAVVETIHSKKDQGNSVSLQKEGGFQAFIGRMLEKVCSPRGSKND
ncbi:uncharacterized protein LOC121250923 isoform X2 [Juglans microcarpa x Juglans regia]|uniref:uncharacterized protein LOC121250923 isoform X2 n=1 Tax=Juglans microcarpa x Juglans regia TaxID=2249226 RepID=UPI001B7EAAB3|nr:uncharacterized protein LOC121250923 isoform X2 [Juglans microcarpa x Juglans regia]